MRRKTNRPIKATMAYREMLEFLHAEDDAKGFNQASGWLPVLHARYVSPWNRERPRSKLSTTITNRSCSAAYLYVLMFMLACVSWICFTRKSLNRSGLWLGRHHAGFPFLLPLSASHVFAGTPSHHQPLFHSDFHRLGFAC